MATSTNLLTVEQYMELPDAGHPTELVRGEVVMMNVPNYWHGFVAVNIAFELRLFLTKHPLGTVVGNDAGIITQRNPDSVRGPDVSYYSYARLPKGTRPKGYPPVPADLVFEVMSPSDSAKKLSDKAKEYLRAGVAVTCIVDPDAETVTSHRSTGPAQLVGVNELLTLEDVLPGFAVEVRKFFGK